MALQSKIVMLVLGVVLSGYSAYVDSSSTLQKYKCSTGSKGIKGCWAVGCVAYVADGLSEYQILEFTKDRILIHNNVYTSPNCSASTFAYSNVEDINEQDDYGYIYQVGTRVVEQGQDRVEYDDFIFSFTKEWVIEGSERFIRDVDGAIAYHIKGGKLCVMPSQVTKQGFQLLSDDMLNRVADIDYFTSGNHLRDMSMCLARY